MQHRASVLVIGFAVGAVLCSAQLTSYHNNANKVSNSQLTPSISGTVTGIDGTPVHDIRIELRSLANGAALQKCLSSADGTYDLTRLLPGKYELVAEDGVNEARERVTVGTGASNVDLHMKAHARAPMSPSVSVAALRIPDKARHLLEKARNAINRNRWQEAEKFVASALMVSPDYADALTTRAILKMIARQTDSALDDLDHAIKSDPNPDRPTWCSARSSMIRAVLMRRCEAWTAAKGPLPTRGNAPSRGGRRGSGSRTMSTLCSNSIGRNRWEGCKC